MALSKISKSDFLHLFVAFLLEVHFLKGNWQKSFPYEIIEYKVLCPRINFNAVVYGAVPVRVIMHNLQSKNCNQLKFWSYNLFFNNIF